MLMRATQVARPFHTKGWVYEEKIDGWGVLALEDGRRVRLVNRNERDHTRRFPEIVAALTALKPSTFTLDGEVAVFVQLGEADYRKEPLKIRRKALEKLLKGLAAWVEVLHRGYEGMVAKDPRSPYVGGRTLKWLFRAQERGFYKPGKPLRDVAADQPTGPSLGS